MSIGAVIAVLQNVPWTVVIEKTPKVVEAAKGFWKSVANKNTPPESFTTWDDTKSSTDNPIAAHDLRIAQLESEIVNIHNKLGEAAALIKDLADQNAQLVKRIEYIRTRFIWFAALTATLIGTIIAVLFLK